MRTILSARYALQLIIGLFFLSAAFPPITSATTYYLEDYAYQNTVQAEEVVHLLQIAQKSDLILLGRETWDIDTLCIAGEVSFHDTIYASFTLNKPGYCTMFLDSINFNSSTFSSEANFGEVTFLGFASFDGVTFLKDAIFGYTKFSNNASFIDAKFYRAVDFGQATFTKIAYFPFTTFSNFTTFHHARFSNVAVFTDGIFSDNVYFNEATFSKGVSFVRSKFFNDVDFSGVLFASYTLFNSTAINHNAIFESASFGFSRDLQCTVDLTDLLVNQRFYLRDADFQFCNEIILDNAILERLYIEWESISGKIATSDTTNTLSGLRSNYLLLEQEFRETGRHDYEDACYFERKKRERPYLSLGLRIFSWIMWAACGYGVKPHYTLATSGVLILLFSLVYQRKGAIVPSSAYNTKKPLVFVRRSARIANPPQKQHPDDQSVGLWKRAANALYFSANTFTTIGYGDYVPTDKKWIWIPWFGGRKLGPSFRFIAMFEGILGWLLMALFLVTLGRVFIR